MKKFFTDASTVVSYIFDPRVTFYLLFLYIAFIVHSNIVEGVIVLVYSSLASLYVTRANKEIEEFDDERFEHTGVQWLRYKTFILTTGISLIFITVALFSGQTADLNYFLFLLVLSITMLLIAFTFRFKISAHIAYTGMLIFYFFQGTEKYTIFVLLTLLIGSARVYLKKHNIKQVAAAFCLLLFLYLLSDALLNVYS